MTVNFLPSEVTPEQQICKREQSSHAFWIKETNNKSDTSIQSTTNTSKRLPTPPTTPAKSDFYLRKKRETTLTNITVTETRHPVTCVNWPGNPGKAYWKWEYEIPSTCHSESWKQYV